MQVLLPRLAQNARHLLHEHQVPTSGVSRRRRRLIITIIIIVVVLVTGSHVSLDRRRPFRGSHTGRAQAGRAALRRASHCAPLLHARVEHGGRVRLASHASTRVVAHRRPRSCQLLSPLSRHQSSHGHTQCKLRESLIN